MSGTMDGPGDGRLAVDLTEDQGRYHRQTLISWWRQDRLAQARVLVVGAGALGNELVKNLALAGVGHVTVIDMDRVENSNLSRCVFFRESDEGEFKSEVVCSRAAELNADTTFVPVVGDVRHAFGLAEFREFDVVLGGLDNREARLHTNQACWKTETPWVDGAIEGLMGVVRAFVPPDSACYECTMSKRDHELLAKRKTCALLTREEMLSGKVPTTGTSGSVIAAMQVQEAIKLLHRDQLEYSFAGKGFAFNGLTHDSYVVTYPRREFCMSHDSYDLAGGTSVPARTTFGEMLAQGREKLDTDDVVLDLEHDVLLSLSCPRCQTREEVRLPVTRVTAGIAICPTCDDERVLDVRHTIEPTDEALLGLTPADLSLPARDVVTARDSLTRHHFVIEAPVPQEAQRAA